MMLIDWLLDNCKVPVGNLTGVDKKLETIVEDNCYDRM